MTYYEEHKEERKAYYKKYREINLNTILEKSRLYCKAHKEERNEKSRLYHKAHKEERNEKCRLYYIARKEGWLSSSDSSDSVIKINKAPITIRFD